ncbi:MAG: lysophospholipid acyltransferase family protein [Verrucomicrobiales bacterium]
MKSQIKTSRKARLSGRLAAGLIRLLAATVRVSLGGRTEFVEGSQNAIFVIWHNRILLAPYVWKRFFQRPGVVLTSASRDGAMLETAVGAYGMKSVRGSSSRRGAAALVALKKEAEKGADIFVTPDGPKGPRYELKPGLVKLAQVTGLPVVTVRVSCSRKKVLRTWDRFQIPLPFSKYELSLEQRFAVPRELDEAGFEAKRREIEEALLSGLDD